MAKAPKMFNFFLKQPWVQKLSEKKQWYDRFTAAVVTVTETAAGGEQRGFRHPEMLESMRRNSAGPGALSLYRSGSVHQLF